MASFPRKITTPLLLLAAAGSLSACAATQPGMAQREAKMDSVLQRAAHDAESEGRSEQSLAIIEQLYKRNSSDPAAALNYARVLRQENYFNRAALVLKPFATAQNTQDPEVFIEYASIMAAMGNYKDSEEVARKAVVAAPESGQAYHVLGIALDAQGHHEQAQVAFEKGLEYWEGNPSPILNNMGLNLAAQGFLDEAIETLRKAMDTAPNRMEIERNLRIVSALQYQPPIEGTRQVPPPPKKPDMDASPAAPEAEGEAAAAPVEQVDQEETPN